MSVEQAEAEADFVLDIIKDYPISYPVAFDVEDANTQGKLPKDQLTAIIKKFCDKVEAAGYYPIVYANDYWIANKLDMNALKKYDIWVARYNVKHSYPNPVMWQATSTGIEGKYVPLSETIRGFKEILDGKHDDIPEQYFLNAGTIDEVVERASK